MPPVTRPSLSRLEWLLLALAMAGVAVLAHAFATPGIIGWVNDDGQYANYARALAAGLGYVDTSFPHHPPASRFPIGFPALLVPVIAGVDSLATQVARLQWVSPVAMALFVGLSYVYFRRFAALPLWLAVGLALLLAVHPDTNTLSGHLLSDLPFACVGLLAVMGVESGLRRERPNWAYWLGLGALVGAGCLMRYTGFALVVALGAVLLYEKRFRPLLAGVAGFVLVFGPWLVFRLMAGGEGYHEWFGASTPEGGSPLTRFFGMSAAMLLTNSVPGYLAPSFFLGHDLGTFAAGTALSAVTLLGAVAGVARPRPEQTRLPAAYLLVLLALVLVWMVQFVLTWSEAMNRLVLPVAPFILLAFVRGVQELALALRAERSVWAGRAAMAGLAIVCLAGSFDFVGRWRTSVSQPHQALLTDCTQMFAFLRERTPPDARLVTMSGAMVHLFSQRHIVYLPTELSNAEILQLLSASDADYVIGVPYYLYLPAKGGGMVQTDVMQVVVGDMIKAHPTVLKPVHFGKSGHVAVFQVDKREVASSLAKLKPPVPPTPPAQRAS